MPVSTSATNGARSRTVASIRAASQAEPRSVTIGKLDSLFSAPKQISKLAADDTFAPYKFSNPWFGTLRGRAGFAINNVLLFSSLGLAYGDLKGQPLGIDESKTLVGWTGSFGMEVGFTPNWSAKVEYLYMDLGSRAYTITGVDNGLRASYLRFGVNYHF
jgi:outer membrane immunogenic protein